MARMGVASRTTIEMGRGEGGKRAKYGAAVCVGSLLLVAVLLLLQLLLQLVLQVLLQVTLEVLQLIRRRRQ